MCVRLTQSDHEETYGATTGNDNKQTTNKKFYYIMDPEKDHNWQLGQNGEEIAGDWLIKHGFRIFHRNWNLHRGCELDLVAFKNNELHFVEVKTRRKVSDVYGRPEQAINYKKLRNMQRAAFHYINTYHYNYNMHFDAIGIVYQSEQNYSVKFIPDISTMPGINYSFNRRY